jgi:hypothetical protein
MGHPGRSRFWILGAVLGICFGFSIAAGAEGTEKPAVLSSLSAQIYGYVRLDAAYDTARIYPGNYALWVKSAYFNRGDDAQLNLTANQTRLGLNLAGPDVAGAKSTGKVEFDFYGGGTENKPNPMMRHAYLELYWPDRDLGILLGQTWDVVSPLSPDTVNFLVCSMAGEIGYRRPQVRLTQGIGVGEKSKIVLKVAAAREIGETLTGYTYKEGPYPAVQGSVAYTAPLFTSQPVHIGVSGVWGKEEYDVNTGGWVDFPLYALSADLALPLVDGLSLKANAWKGTNLDAYLGGILQGVNPSSRESINAQGAWVSVNVAPASDLKFNSGASVDLPQLDQLPTMASLGDSYRSQNSVVFANVIYTVSGPFQLGFEVSYWQTRYKQIETGTSMRYQAAAQYNF